MRSTSSFIRNLSNITASETQSLYKVHEKYKALKEIENGLSKKEAASKYKVALNTISTWLKNKEKIIN